MTLLFFCLSGLDVLNSLETIEDRKAEIIDWIYAQQILPDATNPGIIVRCIELGWVGAHWY